jgi:hypothetical protein
MSEVLDQWIARARRCIRHGVKEDCPICNLGAKPRPKRPWYDGDYSGSKSEGEE